MVWQDIVISVANIFFILSLTNQVYFGFKEKSGPIKFLTSIPTFTGLFVTSYAFWTLELYSSSVVIFLSGTLWFLLFVQRMLYKK